MKNTNDSFEEITFGRYNSRKWLNDETSSFTGSLVCYFTGTEGEEYIDCDGFIELADCASKIRIHSESFFQSPNKPLDEFLVGYDKYQHKIQTLVDELNNYLNFIKDNRQNMTEAYERIKIRIEENQQTEDVGEDNASI